LPDSQRSRTFVKKWLLLSILVLFIAAGVFLLMGGHPYVFYLSVYDGRSGEVIYRERVEMEDTLVLDYIHSADATPVSAVFKIREDGLHLIEEKYSWYGAGLESGAGHQFTFQDQEVTVSGYDRVFEELPLRVARTVPQELVIGEEIISLNQLAPGGTLLVIRIDRE